VLGKIKRETKYFLDILISGYRHQNMSFTIQSCCNKNLEKILIIVEEVIQFPREFGDHFADIVKPELDYLYYNFILLFST
jgi:hypothetical protein